jgi:hypothetical protein
VCDVCGRVCVEGRWVFVAVCQWGVCEGYCGGGGRWDDEGV